jgi:hypothetical protein
MARFTFKKARTVYNGVKFLSSLVARTGQNNPPPSGEERHGCIITEATVRQSGNDAIGQVEYNCSENSKKGFEQIVRECAKSNDNIEIEWQR